MTDAEQLDVLAAACERDLGDPDLWVRPAGYPNSLALCVIDSIYSTGAHYSQVLKIVNRYDVHRKSAGGDAYTDGAPELLGSIEEAGGPSGWATSVAINKRPTSTKPGAPLKAAAVYEAAAGLQRLRVSTTDDLRSRLASDDFDEVKLMWLAVPGQRSGITWEYAMMLAGIPGVKADRMVVRYVARVLDLPARSLGPRDAARLVKAVAGAKEWNVIHMDHAIWRFESGRA